MLRPAIHARQSERRSNVVATARRYTRDVGELFSGWRFVPARVRAGWRLLLVAAVGVVAASSLLAAAPIYADSMANLGLQFRLGSALSDSRLNWVAVDGLITDAPDLERRRAIDGTFDARLGWLGSETLTGERSGRLTLDVKPTVEDAAPGDPTDEGPDWAAFVHALSSLEALTTVVEGRLPASDAAAPEVVLFDDFQPHVALGQRLSLNLGGFDDCLRAPFSEDATERADEVACQPTTRLSQTATVTVVGFVRPRDREDPRWEMFEGSLEVPAEPLFTSLQGLSSRDSARAFAGEGSMPLLTVPDQIGGAFARAMPLASFQHRVGTVVDVASVETNEVERAIAAGEQLRTDINSRLDVTASISLPAVRELERFRTSLSFNQVPLLLILLQVAGIVIYYVVIVSSTLVERQAEEISVLRSRGASAVQLSGLYLLEGSLIAVVAATIGPWLAVQAVGALGFTPTFHQMTGGSALPAAISPAAVLLGTGGALLALIAMLLPAVAASRRDIVDVKAEQARPPGRSLVQRYYLDVAVVALAALMLWQLQQRGSVFDPEAVGGWSADPLLLASPFVLTLAVAGIVLRFYPPLLRLTVGALLLAGSVAVALGLRRAARAPAAYARLMLLLVMAIAVGTFAASYAPTVDRSTEDRLRYESGADFRTGIAARSDIDLDGGLEAIRTLEGVGAAALATRTSVTTLNGTSIPTLGLDPDHAASMLWFRDDFAEEAPAALLRRLDSVVPSGGGLELPAEAVGVTMEVFGEVGRSRSRVWARFRDADGRYHNEQLGRADFEGWDTLTAAVPAGAPLPMTFAGILITDERAAGTRREGALYFDDVAALLPDGGQVLLDDFESRLGWTLFGLLRADEDFGRSEVQARSGSASMRWEWRAGITEGDRLLALNPGNVPLAAIVSPSVAERFGATPGVILTVHLEEHVVPLSVRAVTDFFPTLNPEGGFVVVNSADLAALAALLDVAPGWLPNELWASFEASEERRIELVEVLTGEDAPLPVTGRPVDLGAGLARVRADPTLRASGSGILVLAFTSVILLAALGIVVTLMLGARGRTLEFAVLRAVGSSRLQILRAMALEWGVVLVLGMLVGVLLGRQIAELMLSFLDVTEDGVRVLPPFVLRTDWLVLSTGAFALLVVVAAALGLAWGAAVRRADAAQLRITR